MISAGARVTSNLNIPGRSLCSALATGSLSTPTPPDSAQGSIAPPPSDPPRKPICPDPRFEMISKRKIKASPILRLEAVALPRSVQDKIEIILSEAKMTPKDIRRASKIMDRVVATETAHERRAASRGSPLVEAPPPYDPSQTAAYIATRSPGTYATNVHVMTEARRCIPQFSPKSMLDFGSGPGISVMAAARVFSVDDAESLLADIGSKDNEDDGADDHGLVPGETVNNDEKENVDGFVDNDAYVEHEVPSSIEQALLVDYSKSMLSAARKILPGDKAIGTRMRINVAESFQTARLPRKGHDLVCASYSLGEIIRDAMVNPASDREGGGDNKDIRRDERMKLAERRVERVLKRLWAQTAPGGIFIAVENGTAAGFETIVFARETIRRSESPWNIATDSQPDELKEKIEAIDEEEQMDSEVPVDPPATGVRVVAPCIHTKPCPLGRTITRHRVCRFEQRYNRPPFLRSSRPISKGFEDEFFSYVVMQKAPIGGFESQEPRQEWGRIVRSPNRKKKHVILDACTRDGALERRVVAKKGALPGHFARARKSRWGDVWPVRPSAEPQIVNF